MYWRAIPHVSYWSQEGEKEGVSGEVKASQRGMPEPGKMKEALPEVCLLGRVKVGAGGSRYPHEVSSGRKSILDGTTATDQSLSAAAGGWWGDRRARRLSVKGFPSQGSVTSRVGSAVTPCAVVHRTPLSVGFRRHRWVAVSFSRGSSQLRDGARVSCIGRRILRR